MIDTTERPTKILEPPSKEFNGKTTVLVVVTDKGKFTARAPAPLIGFKNVHSWTQRLKSKGWRHPDILKPPAPKGHFISGEPMESGDPADFGTAEWRALGDIVRNHNLKKIPRACCEHLRGDACAMGCQ